MFVSISLYPRFKNPIFIRKGVRERPDHPNDVYELRGTSDVQVGISEVGSVFKEKRERLPSSFDSRMFQEAQVSQLPFISSCPYVNPTSTVDVSTFYHYFPPLVSYPIGLGSQPNLFSCYGGIYSAFHSAPAPLIIPCKDDWNQLHANCVPLDRGSVAAMKQMIPPPPVLPIINPIVYSNNHDLGTRDLEYIAAEDLPVLNSHAPRSISIPRPSVPVFPVSPQLLIPSLLQSSSPSFDSQKDKPCHLNSPSSVYSFPGSETPMNSNKLHVIGFSWKPDAPRTVSQDDIWVKPCLQ